MLYIYNSDPNSHSDMWLQRYTNSLKFKDNIRQKFILPRVGILAHLHVTDPSYCLWTHKFHVTCMLTIMCPSGYASIRGKMCDANH